MSVHPTAGPHLVTLGRDDLWQPWCSRGDSQPLSPPLRPPSAAGSIQRTTWRSRKSGSSEQSTDDALCADGAPQHARLGSAASAGCFSASPPLQPAELPVDLDLLDHHSMLIYGHVAAYRIGTDSAESNPMPRVTVSGSETDGTASCGPFVPLLRAGALNSSRPTTSWA